ncbi:hypothetical protein K439DRAFT_1618651 [Ramaria rubella]|nr:hypothetical protein K439DRAFT_1618651 [Ramaria rubella]
MAKQPPAAHCYPQGAHKRLTVWTKYCKCEWDLGIGTVTVNMVPFLMAVNGRKMGAFAGCQGQFADSSDRHVPVGDLQPEDRDAVQVERRRTTEHRMYGGANFAFKIPRSIRHDEIGSKHGASSLIGACAHSVLATTGSNKWSQTGIIITYPQTSAPYACHQQNECRQLRDWWRRVLEVPTIL